MSSGKMADNRNGNREDKLVPTMGRARGLIAVWQATDEKGGRATKI